MTLSLNDIEILKTAGEFHEKKVSKETRERFKGYTRVTSEIFKEVTQICGIPIVGSLLSIGWAYYDRNKDKKRDEIIKELSDLVNEIKNLNEKQLRDINKNHNVSLNYLYEIKIDLQEIKEKVYKIDDTTRRTESKIDELLRIAKEPISVKPEENLDKKERIQKLIKEEGYEWVERTIHESKVSDAEKFFYEGNVYYYSDKFEMAEEMYRKAIELKPEFAPPHNNLGIVYQRLSNFKKAIICHGKALDIFKEIGDLSGESKCYGNLGAAYHSLGDFKKAIEFHNKSLKMKKEIGDQAGESVDYTNLGNAYHSLGDFKKAIEFHNKSLKMKKEIGDQAGESKCYGNLGAAYHSLGDFKKAIEFHNKSLKMKKEIGDQAGESKCYGNLGLAYANLGDFKKALIYHNKALKIAKDISDRVWESACYGNLGTVYHTLGDFKKAIEFHNKALKIAKEIGDLSGGSKCYTNLGNAYHSLGDSKKALIFYEKAVPIFKKTNQFHYLKLVYENMAIAYRKMNNHEKVGEYKKMAENLIGI